MIIQSIKLYNFKSRLSVNQNTATLNKIPISNSNDIFQLSFNGIFESSTTPVNLEQAKEYSTIHCPHCGIKMLSKSKHEQLIQQALNAKNGKEFLRILNENREFISIKYERIFEDIEKIPNYEKLSIPELRNKLNEFAIETKRKEIFDAKNFMTEYAKKFPIDKCKKALNTLKNLHTKQNYILQKGIIEQYIRDLELSDTETKNVKSKVLKKILYADSYFRVFNSSKLQQISEKEYGAFMVKRLFYPSLSKIVPIIKYPLYENLPNNKVLICNDCFPNQSKHVFWKYNNSRNFKNNVRQYLTDISYLMGNKEMDYSNDYVKAFTYIVNKITKNDIIFTPDEIKAIRNVSRISGRHEGFAPIEQTEVDIPCAECGSIMLPHKKRKQIESEMKKCNTPYEYAQVLIKYYKYIGKHHRTLAKIFLNIIDDNPNISKEDFIKEFCNQEYNYTKSSFERAFRNFREERSFVENYRSAGQLESYDIFAERIEQYLNEGKFENFEINQMLRECMPGIDFKNNPVRPVYLLIRNLKNIAYKHQCTGTTTTKSFDDKDGVYTILFHLFSYNVATADHLVAEQKGGEGDKYNLIGLCKNCNRTKAQKKVKNWLSEDKKTIMNLKKQLYVIDGMAKSGMLEGYNDWAKNIARKVFQLTDGWYDLRKEF